MATDRQHSTRVETDRLRRRHTGSGDRRVVHLVLHGRPAGEPFLAQVLIGALEAARQHHLELVTVPGTVRDRRGRSDGLVLAGPMTAADVIAAQTIGVPLVCLGRWDCDGPPATMVGNDDVGGADAAATHVHAHGHRRIAFIAAADATGRHWRDRRAGWRQALTRLGLPADLEVTTSAATAAASAESFVAAWRGGLRASAVVAANDDIAAGVYAAAKTLGLRIPQDLSVVGFDDVDDAARMSPPLTTMQVAKQTLGQAAIESLIRLLAGETVADRRLNVRLIPRASVASPRAG